jgi:hypothetical protein
METERLDRLIARLASAFLLLRTELDATREAFRS